MKLNKTKLKVPQVEKNIKITNVKWEKNHNLLFGLQHCKQASEGVAWNESVFEILSQER